MKSTITQLCCLIIFFLIGNQALATDAEKEADKIINKHLKAIGGTDNWQKIKVIRIIKKPDYSKEYWSNTITIRGKGLREEKYYDRGGNGAIQSIICVSPTESWVVRNGFLYGANKSKYEKEKKEHGIEKQIDTLHQKYANRLRLISTLPWFLLEYKEKNIKASFKGKLVAEMIGEVNEVAFTIGEETIATFCFSVRYHYLMKAVYGSYVCYYDDYKTVENVKFPFTETEFSLTKKNEPMRAGYMITQVMLNENIMESVLNRPSN